MDHSDSPFHTSITDLMTSLAVIFIMLLVGYMNATGAHLNELQKQMEPLESVKDKLKSALTQAGYKPEDDPDDKLAIVYHADETAAVSGDVKTEAVTSGLHFEHDKHNLDERGRQFLRRFIPTLVSVTASPEYKANIESVLIEGHTDSTGTEERNLELSQQRALSVLQFGLTGCALNEQQQKHLLRIASITGRGRSQLLPRGSAHGEEDKAKSRRVDFKIRVKSHIEKP